MASKVSTRVYRCAPSMMKAAFDEVRRMGGTVTGSDSEGTVSVSTPLGAVEGRYSYDGEQLSLELLRKPPLVPAELIWERLDTLCGPPVATA